MHRGESVKGQKDRVDIICVLKSGMINWKYNDLLIRKFGAEAYPKKLKEMVSSANIEFEYLGIINYREIKKIKDRILYEISN